MLAIPTLVWALGCGGHGTKDTDDPSGTLTPVPPTTSRTTPTPPTLACAADPCANGACYDLADGGFFCDCADGWSGATCEGDVDECAPSPCVNGGTCTDGGVAFTCACPAGFTGARCEVDVDDCASGPCSNGGQCCDGVDTFTCDCAPGWTGPTCAVDVDDCSPDPCRNGGVCTDGIDSFACACAAGFSGPLCEIDVDECASAPCLNGGVCTDLTDGFACACVGPYFGADCGCELVRSPRYDGFGWNEDLGYTDARGFQLEPTEDLVVTALGVVSFDGVGFRPSGSYDPPYPDVFASPVSPIEVGLYDDVGLVASATVQPTDPLADGYRWASIAPVPLLAGNTYSVLAVIGSPNAIARDTIVHDPRLGPTIDRYDTSDVWSTLPPAPFTTGVNQSAHWAGLTFEVCP